MNRTYAIHGLGKLGASMAAAIASRGFSVIGVDVNERAVESVNAGRAPVGETGLADAIAANAARIRATLSHEEAVLAAEVSFVIVPTLSDHRGAFSLEYAVWAFQEIGRALRRRDGYHLVVMTSTVLPGSTRHGLLPVLERESGKLGGRDFGLCYSPEFIALGSVLHDFLHPDFTLVGELDARSGDVLEAAYAEIMPDRPPCKRMSLENAELTKVALNTYVTTKIAYANMLADLCERIPFGNVDVVADALGTDKRIGHNYLRGGLGYGGPCFPRDNVALGFLARSVDVAAPLAEITDGANRARPTRLADRVCAHVDDGATVAVLGLSYKPRSQVTEESQAMQLVRALSKRGVRVVCYDPLANDAMRAELGYQALLMDSLPRCLEQARVVVVANADDAFRALRAEDFAEGTTVIDCWRVLATELSTAKTVRYVAIGWSADDEANDARLRALWSHDGPRSTGR